MAALPAPGLLASRLVSQPLLSPPGPVPASACPMSVSLVVIRLELAEHSPVPAGFGFSAAGKSRRLPCPAPRRRGELVLPKYRLRKRLWRRMFPQEGAKRWLVSFRRVLQRPSQVQSLGSPARPLPHGASPPALCLYLAPRRRPGLRSSVVSCFPLGFVRPGTGFPVTLTVPGLIKSFL